MRTRTKLTALAAGAVLVGAVAATAAMAAGQNSKVFFACEADRTHAVTKITFEHKPTCPQHTDQVSWNQNQGPASSPILPEAWRQCTPAVCIDDIPDSGTGGWYNAAGTQQITSVNVGDDASLNVTALTPDGVSDLPDNATWTLTFNSDDLKLTDTSQPNGDSSAVCQVSTATPLVTCAYTDFGHTIKSDSYFFTAVGANPFALVTATVLLDGGETASATFPLQINS
jgi:hypothetical protein